MPAEFIKKCPHCGGNACLTSNYSHKYRSYFVFVRCDVCGAQGKIYTSNSEPAADEWSSTSCTDAINAWNMRYQED